MKSISNFNEISLKLRPDSNAIDNINAFNTYSQTKFNQFLKTNGLKEVGEISTLEDEVFNNIKAELVRLKSECVDIDRDRLEFDLAIVFHRNLKKLGWGRWNLNDISMWRWLSLNYFRDETFWRRGENKFHKHQYFESAKSTYDHLIGSRIRDIFPRRYFLLGERLYDKNTKYDLLKKLSFLSKNSKSGGFGNLILNIIDTKLISPNDHVSKIISELLFIQGKLAEDKEVVRAFVRYNGYKRRLLITAGKDIFEKEICIG